MKRLTTISPAKKAARREGQTPRVVDRSSVFSATLHSPLSPLDFNPNGARKDGKMEEDGERERCANVVGARKEAENTPLSPRYFSLNGTRAAEMDVPCPCVFLPSPPPPSSRPKLLPVESRRGERGCDEVEEGKRNARNEEEGRKESFGSGACGCGARGGKNVERRKTDGGGSGGWLVERA